MLSLSSVTTKMKKPSERRKHCALAVVRRNEKFRPAAIPPPNRLTESAMAVVRQSQSFPLAPDPLPGGAVPPKFNQLEMVITCTLQTQFDKDRCTQLRVIVVGNRHRPPAANTQTHRQARLQYTAPLASAQCNDY